MTKPQTPTYLRRRASHKLSKQARSRRFFAPHLEGLEDRRLMAISVFQDGFDAGLGGGVYMGTQDVVISQASPATNLNAAGTDLGTKLAVASDALQTLIRFDNIFGNGPGQIPLGAAIVSATLTVDTNTTGDGGHFHRMIASWDEATATWDSMANGIQTDGVEAESTYRAQVGTSSRNGDPAAVSTVMGVTSDLQAWSSGAPNRGWGMIAWTGGSANWQFSNSEATNVADRPKLTVEWLPPGTVSATFREGVNGYTGAQDTNLLQTTDPVPAGGPPGNTTPQGSVTSMNTDYDDATPDNNAHVLIQFQDFIGTNPGQVPPGSTVIGASLSTAATPSNGTGDGGTFHRMLVPWSEADATWESMVNGISADNVEASSVVTVAAGNAARTPNAEGGYFEWNVTADVQAWVTGTAANNGWAIRPWVSGSDGWVIASSENTTVSDRPALTVFFNPPLVEGPTNELDLVGGVLTFKGGLNLANALNIGLTAGNYTFADATPITVSAAAQAAGWTGTGTNTVTGPSSSVNSIRVRTGTGDDTVTLAGADDTITLDGGANANDSLNITGNITIAGNLDVIDFTNVTQAPNRLVDLGNGTATLTVSNGLGTSADPLRVRTATLIANAGNGGIYITESDGTNATVNASGSGPVVLTNTTGTLNMQGTSSSEGGEFTINSGDDVLITGIIGDTLQAGNVTINANTDGAGSQGYTQTGAGGVGGLANVTINVNTAAGGTGNALVGAALLGGNYSVSTNNGSILWNAVVAVYPANGTVVIRATNYFFTNTGATSSVGTLAAPIQTDVLANASRATVASGGGGVYITDNGADGDISFLTISVTGDADIDLKTSSVAGHDLALRGNITAGTGDIRMIADDAFIIQDGITIGGPGFSGTVSMMMNRDEGNEQRLTMGPTAAIVTSNNTANAVFIEGRAATNNSGSAIGGLTVANITVGNGGTITLNAATGSATNPAGNIVMANAANVLDAGVNGNVVLITKDNPIGTSALPIRVNAANVTVTTNSVDGLTANTGQQPANIFVRSVGAANFAAITTTATDGGRVGNIDIGSEAGVLTVNGLVAADSGTVSITGAGGVVLAGPVGDANTTGNITVTATAGTVIATSNQAVLGAYTLSLQSTAAVQLGPQTEVKTGGTLTSNQNLEVGNGDTLLGAGTVTATVIGQSGGTVSPGNASTAILNTNNLTMQAGSKLAIDLNSTTAGSGHDQVNVTGAVNLTGSTLQLTQTIPTPTVGQQFTIINNDGTSDPVVGQFASGATIVLGTLTFGINYAGGDGNDVVLTLNSITAAPTTFRVTTATITPTGVDLVFSAALDPTTLNLMIVQDGSLGPVDLTLVGATAGAMRGTLIVAADRLSARFIRTGGPMVPDTYTLTMRSTANGFKSATGNLLDGDGNGTAGDDLVAPLVLAAPPAGAISVLLPDFARGPGQPVNVPGNATGIPIRLSDGTGVTAVSLRINYDATLLNVTGAALGPDAPAGATVNTTGSTAGQSIVTFTSPTPVGAGLKNIVTVTSSVPDTAPYRNKQILDMSNVQINGGAIAAVADDAVHINAYFGDVNGNNLYGSSDASLLLKVGLGSDSGFTSYVLLDPVIIGDLNASNTITSADASRSLAVAVGSFPADIPLLPSPAVTIVAGGPDPKLSIPRDLVGNPGESIEIPVILDSVMDLTETPVNSLTTVIEYDPALIRIDSVGLGDLGTTGWVHFSKIDGESGRLAVTAGTSSHPLGGRFLGTMFKIQATILDSAPNGRTPLNLMAYGPGVFTHVNEGELMLIPAPSNFASDPVDGLLTIGGRSRGTTAAESSRPATSIPQLPGAQSTSQLGTPQRKPMGPAALADTALMLLLQKQDFNRQPATAQVTKDSRPASYSDRDLALLRLLSE